GDPSPLRARRAATVLTPHPGEAGLLLGTSAPAVKPYPRRAGRPPPAASRAGRLLHGPPADHRRPRPTRAREPHPRPQPRRPRAAAPAMSFVRGARRLRRGGKGAPEAAAPAESGRGCAGARTAARGGPWGLRAGGLADELPAAAEARRGGARLERSLPHLALD